jgi:hypothetical protein
LSEGTLEFTDEVIAKLEELHPAATPITFQKPGQCEALEVTSDLVRQMIKTFPKGMRAQHLAEALSVGCLADSCIAAFTSLVNLYLAANSSLHLTPFVSSATLIALKKKNGGVRRNWRNLASTG